MAHIIDRKDWAESPEGWKGELQCGEYGSNICLIFNVLTEIGDGPRLHRHPYSETFIILSGQGLFTVGDEEFHAKAGQILIVPANTPHKFSNLGPGALETTDIHDNGKFITEWLE